MFERFTDAARRVVVGAQAEAMALDHNYIGTEHILLGLLREGEGVGAQVLAARGVTWRAVWNRLDDVEREGPPSTHHRRLRAEPPEPMETREVESEDMVQVSAEQFARLVAEIARLRDLLRHHGIDPGEELPDFGQD